MVKSTSAAFFMLLTVILSATLAQGIHPNGTNNTNYPAPQDDYINDFADVLQATDALRLRNTLRDLEARTGIEGCVVTIKNISDFKTGASNVDHFATNLFNTWGIGNRNTNNGFLFLISVQDRQCRIELGNGYGVQYNAAMQQVMDQTIIPQFKVNDTSRGIYDGTLRIIDALTTKHDSTTQREMPQQHSLSPDFKAVFNAYRWHLLGGGMAIVFIMASISCFKSGRSGWGYAFLAIAGTILITLLTVALSGSGRRRGSGWGGGGGGGFGGGSSSGSGGASGSW